MVGFRAQAFGLRAWGLGLLVYGFGFRVWGLGLALRATVRLGSSCFPRDPSKTTPTLGPD